MHVRGRRAVMRECLPCLVRRCSCRRCSGTRGRPNRSCGRTYSTRSGTWSSGIRSERSSNAHLPPRIAIPSPVDRCRRAHRRRDVACVVVFRRARGAAVGSAVDGVAARPGIQHATRSTQHAARNIHIGALDGFFCAVAPHARSSSCSRSSRYTSSAIRPQPPQTPPTPRTRRAAPGRTVQYRTAHGQKQGMS